MDKKLLEIAEYAQILTEDKTDSGLIDGQSLRANMVRLEDATIGERAMIRFRCPNCYSEFDTKNRYKIRDNYAEQVGRAFTFSSILSWLVDNTLARIPIIGETFSVHADEYESKQGSKITEKRSESVQLKAFNAEMAGIFTLCNNNQHGVCCPNCINEKK